MITNIVKLNKELAALRIEKTEVATKMGSYDEDMKKLQEQVKLLEADKAKLEETIKGFKKDEAAVVVAVQESVNEKVVQKLAAMGVPEGTVADTVAAPAPTTSDVYKNYEVLTGKDKIEFFKKNEKAIMAAMKVMHYVKQPAGPNMRSI